MTGHIIVKCIRCGARKVLTLDEAAALQDVPLCEHDGMPMLAVKAEGRLGERRPRRKRR